MKLWGGRFSAPLNNAALKFSSSLGIDILLFGEDILCSKAHSKMLREIGLLKESEFESIDLALSRIRNEYESGEWVPKPEQFEDVHSAIESRLFELIGDTAGKLHTGRSRNDQVATDLRLWVKFQSKQVQKAIRQTQAAFLEIAKSAAEVIIPGYTHLQRAQPISLAFHLLAYVEMLERDYRRFANVIIESDYCPLGAGALAGSTLPLDRNFTANELGFSNIAMNALDAVSDRDFVIDCVHACSAGMLHLSRFAEEVVLWSSQEWHFMKLNDTVSTGSSLMPQKKNPDLAELTRGKTGRVLGADCSLKAMMKGLPLSYNRDLQEDKEQLFDAVQTYIDSLAITQMILANSSFDNNRFENELSGSFILSTDIADWLVLRGIPFREAHHITGSIVKYCEANEKQFNQLTIAELISFSPVFDESVMAVFDITTSLHRKQTIGSPNPVLVRKEIARWAERVQSESDL